MSLAVGALDTEVVVDIGAADTGVVDIGAALDTGAALDIGADLHLSSRQIQSSLEHYSDSLQQVVVEPLGLPFEQIFLLFQR